MPLVPIRIPQLGEGLQEALLVEFLKQPGDVISRDEPLFVMETDKATTDVESPYSGTLIEWTVEPGSVLAIGAEIARMEVVEDASRPLADSSVELQPTAAALTSPSEGAISPPLSKSVTHQNSDSSDAHTPVRIPPKTRKYLKDLDLLEHVDRIPIKGNRMMPDDVDAYLALQSHSESSTSVKTPTSDESEYQTVPLPKSQIALNYRMARGAGACIPVTVVTDLDWTNIELARASFPADETPTGFCLVCWAVVRTMTEHSKFRSVLTGDGSALRVYQHVNLGIAVALPNDEMVTAVIPKAELMTLPEFCLAYQQQIQSAKMGRDQANEATTMTVSNIGKAGMRIGIPAIVSPAVATLAIGQVLPTPVPFGESFQFKPMASATLSFDHRIVNGVGAANFMNDLRSAVQTLDGHATA